MQLVQQYSRLISEGSNIMDFNNNSPIYLQVIEMIKKRVLKGELFPGQKLPSTRELALQYEINPNTAARVYTEMEAMGLCFTKRGLGTFLQEGETFLTDLRNEKLETLEEQFIKEMLELGIPREDIIKNLERKIKNADL